MCTIRFVLRRYGWLQRQASDLIEHATTNKIYIFLSKKEMKLELDVISGEDPNVPFGTKDTISIAI
jgi:hypothetical protein